MLLSLSAVVLAEGNDAARTRGQAYLGHGFSVYALSRGQGVPDETRAAFNEIEQLLQTIKEDGRVVSVSSKRIGLPTPGRSSNAPFLCASRIRSSTIFSNPGNMRCLHVL